MTSERVLEEMAVPSSEEFRPVRCNRCGRMLCLEAMTDGALKIKCPRCKNINVIAVRGNGEEAQITMRS